MSKSRMEAFSDGVIAIIITIMVLGLAPPRGSDWLALSQLLPVFLGYILSFVFIGIYWNNHHHMFQVVRQVNGWVLWANLHLLFWLSLIPFATAWMGQSAFDSLPVALYGVILFMAAVAYYLLTRSLIAVEGKDSILAKAVGQDYKGKVSLVVCLVAAPLAFVSTWLACGLYVLLALMWFIPDRRIEKTLAQ